MIDIASDVLSGLSFQSLASSTYRGTGSSSGFVAHGALWLCLFLSFPFVETLMRGVWGLAGFHIAKSHGGCAGVITRYRERRDFPSLLCQLAVRYTRNGMEEEMTFLVRRWGLHRGFHEGEKVTVYVNNLSPKPDCTGRWDYLELKRAGYLARGFTRIIVSVLVL
ncbi:MAG: hypothetical protein PUF51_02310 [Bifidobacteriaceae bacterium]|nr:hypothetical protein [Bifidobacteriaceae bacterium]